MKKILKSILIATASLGTIAGSVATVVSCGSTTDDTPKTNQQDYTDALSSIIKHFKTNALFTIELTTQVPAIQQQIQQNIYNFIKSTGTGALPTNQLNAINVTTVSDIKLTNFVGFTTPAVTPTTGQAIDGHSTNLTISIPAASGLTQGTISCVGAKYIVNAPAVPTDQSNYHTEASTFATSLINFTQQTGKAVEIQSLWTAKSVKESVLSYINDYMNKNYDPTYIAELKVTDLTIEDNSIVQNLTGSTAVATGISINIPPMAGVSANFERFDLNFTYVILQTPDNPQATYDSAIRAASQAFLAGPLFEAPLFDAYPTISNDEIINNIKKNLKKVLLSNTPTNIHIFDFSTLEVQITGTIPLKNWEFIHQDERIPNSVSITFNIKSGTKNVNAPSSPTQIAPNSIYHGNSQIYYSIYLILEYSAIYFAKNPIFRATTAEMADPSLASVKTKILTNYQNYLKTLSPDLTSNMKSAINSLKFTNKTAGIYFTGSSRGASGNQIEMEITNVNGNAGFPTLDNAKFVITN